MTDIHRVPPVSAPKPGELSDELLRPLLQIHGPLLTDREYVEQLIHDCDRAADRFPTDPTAAQIDVYIERAQKVLEQARMIVAKYAD